MGVYSNKKYLSFRDSEGAKIKNCLPQKVKFVPKEAKYHIKKKIFHQYSLSLVEILEKNHIILTLS